MLAVLTLSVPLGALKATFYLESQKFSFVKFMVPVVKAFQTQQDEGPMQAEDHETSPKPQISDPGNR